MLQESVRQPNVERPLHRRSRKSWLLVVPALVLVAVIVVRSWGLPAWAQTEPSAVWDPTLSTAPGIAPLRSEAHAGKDLEDQLIEVYEMAAPSVVNITIRGFAYNRFRQAVPREGSGSGFVYDTKGHVVTNYHVVENAQELLVTLADGQVYDAELVGTDATNDLAVLRIDGEENLPAPLVLGDSNELRVGQFVLAIGNPFGLEGTLTTGVVSALGRIIESPEENGFISEAIQTDAAINPGNSGGPLLNLTGRVIGVNSQIISASGTSSGVGFAVSSNAVRRVVPELILHGHYPHPWLGTRMLALSPSIAEVFRDAGMNLPVDTGLLVVEVEDGSPADKAGILGGSRIVRIGNYRFPLDGDIIVAVDGEAVNDNSDLTVYLEMEAGIGETVELTIIRDGAEQTVAVTLTEQPRE